MVRSAGRISERKIAEQESWHRSVLDEVLGTARHDRGNAVGLQVASDQADGLVAYRAIRHQHRGIYLVGSAACDDVGGINLEGDAMAAICRGAEEARRDFPDSPLVRE